MKKGRRRRITEKKSPQGNVIFKRKHFYLHFSCDFRGFLSALELT